MSEEAKVEPESEFRKRMARKVLEWRAGDRPYPRPAPQEFRNASEEDLRNIIRGND